MLSKVDMRDDWRCPLAPIPDDATVACARGLGGLRRNLCTTFSTKKWEY